MNTTIIIRDSHVTERNVLLLSCETELIPVIFFFLSSFVMLLFCFLFIFRDDTSLFLFNLIFKNLILHIFLIIMIIVPCSGMFRNIPGCSGMFHIPGFIDGPSTVPYECTLLITLTSGLACDEPMGDGPDRFAGFNPSIGLWITFACGSPPGLRRIRCRSSLLLFAFRLFLRYLTPTYISKARPKTPPATEPATTLGTPGPRHKYQNNSES